MEKEAGFKFDQEREREKTPPTGFLLLFFFFFSPFFFLFSLKVTHTHTHKIITQVFFFFFLFLYSFLYFTIETCASEFVTAVTGHILRVKDAKQPFPSSSSSSSSIFLFLFRLCSAVWFFSSRGNLLILLSCGHFIYYQFSFLSFLSLSLPFFFSFEKKVK